MADAIHGVQRLIRPFYPELVRFVPEIYTATGLAPNKERERQRVVGDLLSHRLFSRQYHGVPGRIHYQDNMLQTADLGEIARYVEVGRSGLENIERALKLTGRGWADVRRLLDFPSGFGRVLRHIVREMEPRRVTACELMHTAVQFCAEEFGVNPLESTPDLEALSFPEKYDVIWVGSLFTHLPIEAGVRLIVKLVDALEVGGVLVISTQGPTCLPTAEDYGFMFKGRRGEFEMQYAATGAAFLPYYPDAPGYGIAFHAPEFMHGEVLGRVAGRAEILEYSERGYDNHQDVWKFLRVDPAGFNPTV